MANGNGAAPRVLKERYCLRSRLGGGGQGSVWKAEDMLLQREVALKELLQPGSGPDRDERRRRAMIEARAMAKVKHPNIVHIHDVFLDQGDPWLVMDYICGRSLDEVIGVDPLDEHTTASIGLPVLQGLDAAHRVGIVHRDVKPANIVVADNRSIYLVDFGIAKIVADAGLTDQSKIIGTTEFISPERLLGERLTPATDLWSLGVTFFYALEGYSPFRRRGPRSPEATIAAILRDDPPPLKRAGKMTEIVLGLLNKTPEARPTTAEVMQVLQSVIDDRPVRPRYRGGSEKTTRQLEPERVIESPPSHVRQTRSFGPLTWNEKADPPVNVTESASKLLSMSQERAAATIAGYPPRVAAEVIELIYATQPATAGAIFEMISSQSAGRTISHLTSAAASAILSQMPARKAVRILGCADARAAGAVVRELPGTIAVELLKEMDDSKAVGILSHVEPATVACLLSGMGNSSRVLVAKFTPAFRRQILRHLNQ